MILTRDDMLKHRAPKTAEVEALGGTVMLKALSAGDRDLFEQRYKALPEIEKDVTENLRAFFIVCHACDEDGKLLFTMDDLELLSAQPATEMDKLFAVCQSLSGFSNTDEKELKKK